MKRTFSKGALPALVMLFVSKVAVAGTPMQTLLDLCRSAAIPEKQMASSDKAKALACMMYIRGVEDRTEYVDMLSKGKTKCGRVDNFKLAGDFYRKFGDMPASDTEKMSAVMAVEFFLSSETGCGE